MLHALYGPDASAASVALLAKEKAFDSKRLQTEYIDPLGADPAGFIAYSLWYNDKNKAPADLAKDYLKTVLTSIRDLGIKTILISDANYFKFLCNIKKAPTSYLGQPCFSQLDGFEEDFTVFYVPNYQAAKHNPRIIEETQIALDGLQKFLKGNYTKPGHGVVHSARHLMTLKEIQAGLDELLTYPKLTVDIEGLSLKFWECGLSTIAFAWDKHNYIAFPIDRAFSLSEEEPLGQEFGTIVRTQIRAMLKDFFEKYRGKLIFHNAGFDCKVLVYELWMEDLQDYRGMIDGIKILTRDFDDTKVIAYLATNNAVENTLGLKPLARPYLGEYAEDVKATNKVPLIRLLEYNGKDCLGAWYVYEKYRPKMIADHQEILYLEQFKPSIITLLQVELVGMPIIPEKVKAAKDKLTALSNGYKDVLFKSSLMKEYTLHYREELAKKATAKAKKKVYDVDDPIIARENFNPGSAKQKAYLLYEYMGLPVIDTTKSKEPATGADVLEKLKNHTTNQSYLDVIEALIGLAKVDKILTSFIPAFEGAIQMPDGSYRLYGNFNLGGTVSGRLSSSDPNLQNLPSGSTFGKLIKECFGFFGINLLKWLFGGADFNSLEDMISALTTRDPNKMKVYIDGFDGHCLRAFSYFGDQMPDIQTEVAQQGEIPSVINSIKDRYPDERQDSKGPTFALTYQGTWLTLMKNLGLDEVVSRAIEANYHILYKVSDDWVQDKLQKACVDGYVTGAFGLKLRTPLLKANGPGQLKYQAAAEGRTAGNMLGQSYGMLNNRAANEFRERLWNSPYIYDVFLVGLIHDAIYLIWRNRLGLTQWINDNLIECMQWDGLVELQHPVVKVGAELDIFFPNWANPVTLGNRISLEEIDSLCR